MVNVWRASNAAPIGLIMASKATVMVPKIAPTVRALNSNFFGRKLSGDADVDRSGIKGSSGAESKPIPNKIFESGGCLLR